MPCLFSLFLVHLCSYILWFLLKGDFSLFPNACLRIFSSAWSVVLQLSLSSCLLLGSVRGTFHEQKRFYPHFLIFCGSFVWMWSSFNCFCLFSGQDCWSERAVFRTFSCRDGGGILGGKGRRSTGISCFFLLLLVPKISCLISFFPFLRCLQGRPDLSQKYPESPSETLLSEADTPGAHPLSSPNCAAGDCLFQPVPSDLALPAHFLGAPCASPEPSAPFQPLLSRCPHTQACSAGP